MPPVATPTSSERPTVALLTSNRKRKKQAGALGLTPREMELAELLQEVLDSLRWMQILAYSNQYLMNQKLEIEKAERDQILEAATRAVDKDLKLHEWNERLARLKQGVADIQRRMEAPAEETEGVGEETAREGQAGAGGPGERGES